MVVAPPVEEWGSRSAPRASAVCWRRDVAAANRLLGHSFCVDFQVIHGRRLGRRLGFPTINQVFPDGFLLPRFGVYASVTELNGVAYGVTNIGVKAHRGRGQAAFRDLVALATGAEVYGERPVWWKFMAFIRPERKFDSLEGLRDQICSGQGKPREKIVSKPEACDIIKSCHRKSCYRKPGGKYYPSTDQGKALLWGHTRPAL